MTFYTVTLVLRLTAVVLATWALIRLWLSRRRKWKTLYTPKEKVTWRALLIGAIYSGEGAVENIIQNNQEGPRAVLRVIFLIFILLVTYTRDDRRIVFNQENDTQD